MHDRTGSARFEIVASTDLPTGRYCTITEHNTHVTVKLLAGEATSQLCEQLNDWHDKILGEGLWVKMGLDWDAVFEARAAAFTPTSDPTPGPAGRFKIVSEGALPADCACYPIEGDGEFIWQINERHLTQRACDQLNTDLARVMREGSWVPKG